MAVLMSLVAVACARSGLGAGKADAGADTSVAVEDGASDSPRAPTGGEKADADPVGFTLPDAPRAVCGNGILDPFAPFETCDDGNTVGDDGCSQSCWIERGWLCPTPGQLCVRYNAAEYACGNGFLSPSEACDDGNSVGEDGCAADCLTVEPGWRCPAVGRPCVRLCGPDGGLCAEAGTMARCGDGIVDPGEECDDGSDPGRTPHNDDEAYDGCTTLCTYGGYCGDGIVNGPEECDDGAANLDLYGAPGCSFLCKKAHYCGDGIVDSYEDEHCDDGPWNGRGSCTTDCNQLIL
jgi:cysteine-rich repeat protein